jgi:hypothetical protein
MKKWSDIPRNEKRMMLIILLLALAVLSRWAAVKEGIGRGFGWFLRDGTKIESSR